MRMMRYILSASATLLMTVFPLANAQQPTWQISKNLHIGGEGAWDYVTVDPKSNRLFVTRSTHTQIIDTTTGKVIADIPGQSRSHGTAIVPAIHIGQDTPR